MDRMLPWDRRRTAADRRSTHARSGDPACRPSAARSASSIRGTMIAQSGDVRGRDRRGADHRPVRPRPRRRRRRHLGFTFQINLWLWFTVLFANFAEASPKAAARRRPHRCARRKTEAWPSCSTPATAATTQLVPATALQQGDVVLVEAGDMIPSDGEVDRGRRLGQRSGDHRRIRACHPRKRRRPLGGHRRHDGHLRLDQGAASPRPRARPSSTA